MYGETNGGQEVTQGAQDAPQQQGQEQQETQQQGQSQVGGETPDYEKQIAERDVSVSTIICPDSQSAWGTFTAGKSPASRFRYDDRISACRSL